jgi:flagellar assembly factor FliW
MPEFEAKHFGRVAYEPRSILNFPVGLPGFEPERRFMLIEQPATHPIIFLQSLDSPDLCFITLPLLAVEPGYQLELSSEELELLGFAGSRQPEIGTDLLCLVIISVSEGQPPTVNLLAPIVASLHTRQAVQCIQAGERYSHRHPLPAEPQEAPCS